MTFPDPTDLMTCVVLLADDDPDILSLCAQLLAGSGHTVETASDGEAALAALTTGRFEAAVLDVDMPGLTGIEVARDIRAADRTKSCAIVLHTATAKADIDAQFRDYDAFVSKPCFGDELSTALRDAVAARRGARPAPAHASIA